MDTGENLGAMKNQGFDEVLNYKKEDFTANSNLCDLILDCRTNRSPWRYVKVLKPKGKYVSVGARSGKLLLMFALKPLTSLFTGKSIQLVALKGNKDLDYISELYEKKQLQCVIDGPYSFEKLPWAI